MQCGNKKLVFKINDDGTLQFLSDTFKDIFCPEIRLNGKSEELRNPRTLKNTEKEIVFSGCSANAKWLFTAEAAESSIKLRMRADLEKPAKEIKFILFSQKHLKADHIFSSNLRMGECVSIHFPTAEQRSFCGHHFAVLRNGNEYLMLSYPLRNCLMSNFSGIAGEEEIRDFECSSGTQFEDTLHWDSGELTLTCGNDAFCMIRKWSRENCETEKDFSTPLAPGWNSWDYYRWTVTEEEILKNADFIAHDPVLSKHIKRIIVDDGWEYCYGEWEANPYFPHGMKYLAKELSKMGFEPGLWIAPTIAEPHARISQYLPDEMMALGRNGRACLAYKCMARYGFVLDPTVEKSRKFIRDLFNRYAGMGYRYFKLDFLNSTLNAAQFHDRNVPRTDIVRMVVESASEGIGNRAVILGCNYPYCSGNKFVSAVRVGADIHSWWKKIKQNSVSVAGTMWAAETHWVNDPDFALCRSFETADDPDQQKIRHCAVFNTPENEEPFPFGDETLVFAHENEIEVLLSVVLVSSGAINLSDNLTRLNEKGLFLARKVVSAEHGKPGTPIDMFDADHTKTWIQQLEKGTRVLMINWSDSAEERVFDPAAYGITGTTVFDFWKEQAIQLENGMLKATVAPHCCLLAVFE